MLKWPVYEQNPDEKPTHTVGNAVRSMTDQAMASAAANQRQLQQALAAEAKRQRQESLDAAKVLTTEFKRQ